MKAETKIKYALGAIIFITLMYFIQVKIDQKVASAAGAATASASLATEQGNLQL